MRKGVSPTSQKESNVSVLVSYDFFAKAYKARPYLKVIAEHLASIDGETEILKSGNKKFIFGVYT